MRVSIESPFPYREHMRVVALEPGGDLVEETAETLADLARLLGGRTLGLFTSLRRMREVAELLGEKLRGEGFDVLAPRRATDDPSVLVERFVRSGGILLGARTFWQGLDIPGPALQAVVIEKLPFEVPTELRKRREARIKLAGQDAFERYTLGKMLLNLKQMTGRLIRTEEDRGIAVIVEGRTDRRYFARLGEALPAGCRVARATRVELAGAARRGRDRDRGAGRRRARTLTSGHALESEERSMSEKRVALVTGGGTGIGAACCRALAAEGFRVAVHYRSSEETARKLAAELADGFALRADLAASESIDALIAELKQQTDRVDVLVNNAGHNVNAPMLTMKLEDYDAVASVARGTWYLTKLILRRFMLRKGSGRIINVTSVVGHTGNPGQIPYVMVKAGLDAFTKSLAQELAGRDILVNAVAPGFIDTDMTAELPRRSGARS